MIRNFFPASVAAIALTGSAALAADLPMTPPPPPVPVFTWTGIYVGGQVGYAWTSGNLDFTGFDPITGAVFGSSVGGTPSGVIGGAHVGYQVEFNQWPIFSSSGVVVGLEGTVDGTSLRNTAAAFFPDFGGTFVTAHTNADVQGSIRGSPRHCLGSRLDLCHRRRCLRRLQHQLLNCWYRLYDPGRSSSARHLRFEQLFEHPLRLDGWRRYRLCHHQQLVGLCGISLYEFRPCRKPRA